jgi:DNA-binding transcriptional LysR family regulator
MMLNPAQLLRVDLSLLVLFMTVLEEGHVARAADKLNLTPSAVSHGLNRLRRLLQDPLFLKTPRGVKPTERALALAAPVAEILKRVENVIASSVPFDPQTSQRRFAIGAPDALITIFLTPLLELLSREAPGVDLRMINLIPQHHGRPTSAVWDSVLAELDVQQLDLALLPIGQTPPRFQAKPLFDEIFVVAMRKGHPYACNPTLKNYLAQRHMLVSAIGDAHGVADDILAAKGLSRRVALTVPNFMLALTQLSETDLIATLPKRLLLHHAVRFGLETAPVPFPWHTVSPHIVTSKAAMQDASIAWMFDAISRCFAANDRVPTRQEKPKSKRTEQTSASS